MDLASLFIRSIKVDQLRNLSDLDIQIDADEKKHLILTGKNGSGKTTLLEEITKVFVAMSYTRTGNVPLNQEFLFVSSNIGRATDLKIDANLKEIYEAYWRGEFLLISFDSKRTHKMTIPQGIKKLELNQQIKPKEIMGQQFLQHIVNLKADRSFARDEGEKQEADRIDAWFTQLEQRLNQVFQVEGMRLQFDRQNYTFSLTGDGGYSFGLTELSDGYSAVLNLIAEILLRAESHGRMGRSPYGIVLIDEVETHLHVELQKTILPFLIEFFPNIQFIVSTHSPFVIQSIPNTVVYDIEKMVRVEDLSSYSSEALVESYFGIDKYSATLKSKVYEYEQLMKLETLSDEEWERKRTLKYELTNTPKFMAEELEAKLSELHL